MGAIPPKTNIDGIKKAVMDGIDGAFERGKKYGRYLALQEYLQQKEEAKLKWVSTKNRLPEVSDIVLVIASGRPRPNITLHNAVLIASYWGNDDWFAEGYVGWDKINVAHWMPLPEPPKEV